MGSGLGTACGVSACRGTACVNFDVPRSALRRLQLLHGIAAQLIQHGTRREGRAGEIQFDLGELVGRVSQTSQLSAQVVFVDGAILRRAQGSGTLHGHAYGASGPLGAQRLALVRRNAQTDRLFAERGGGFGVDAGGLIYVGIVSAPNEIAAADAGGMDHAVAEAQFAMLEFRRCVRLLRAPRDYASRLHRRRRRRRV